MVRQIRSATPAFSVTADFAPFSKFSITSALVHREPLRHRRFASEHMRDLSYPGMAAVDPTLLSPPVLFRVDSEETNVSRLETSRGCLFLLESHKPSNKESNEGYKRGLPRVTFNVVYVSRSLVLLKHSIHFHIYPYLKVLGWSYREPSGPAGK